MGYQPGPLVLQSAGNVGITTTDYNFAGDVDDQLHELGTTPAGWGYFLDDATLLMGESSDPFPDVDLDAAMQTIHAYSDTAALLGTIGMAQALAVANVQLGQAVGFAPAEAWTDSGAPFVPPVPAEIVGVPYIPPDSLSFRVIGTVSGGAGGGSVVVVPVIPPGGLPATGGSVPVVAPVGITVTTVSLLNLSQYGLPNFRVGDQFQVTALGPIRKRVEVHSVQGGTDLGTGHVGDTDDAGKFVLTGTMDESSAGIWHQDWFVGGALIQSFDYVVVGE